MTGTTGARSTGSSQLPDLVARARSVTDVPLYAGFGIAAPEQAAEAASLADGIVVGSRAVEVGETGRAGGLARVRRVPARGDRRPPACHPGPPSRSAQPPGMLSVRRVRGTSSFSAIAIGVGSGPVTDQPKISSTA